MDQHTQPQSEGAEDDVPLVALFRHNLWANLRLFEACITLDKQQLAATTAGTFGDIFHTLRHVARSEQGYLNLLTYRKQGTPIEWEDNPGVAALREHVQRAGEGLVAVADGTTPTGAVLIKWEDGGYRQIPAGMILNQAINHASEHRTQITTILTQLGIEPPDLSGWAFAEDHVPPL